MMLSSIIRHRRGNSRRGGSRINTRVKPKIPACRLYSSLSILTQQ